MQAQQRDALINQARLAYDRVASLAAQGPPKALLSSLQKPEAIPINGSQFAKFVRAGALGDNNLTINPNDKSSSASSLDSTLNPSSKIPTGPVPRSLIGGFVGLLVGLAAAFVVDRFDNRIRGKEDAESAFGLPVLCEVPPLTRAQRAETEVLSFTHPMSRTAEAYRALRSSLVFLHQTLVPVGGDPAGGQADALDTQVILVTSGGPAEGKTTTVANLAALFAEADNSVLVINCDFRRPRLHRFLGGSDEPRKVVQSDVPGVRLVNNVLSSPNPNPAEVAAAQRQVIETARGMFDVILLDTAPLLSTNDASELVSVADAVVLVAQAGRTTKPNAARATEILQRLEATVAGVALLGTATSPRRSTTTTPPRSAVTPTGPRPSRTRSTCWCARPPWPTPQPTRRRPSPGPARARRARPVPATATAGAPVRRPRLGRPTSSAPPTVHRAPPPTDGRAAPGPLSRRAPRRSSGYRVPLARPKPGRATAGAGALADDQPSPTEASPSSSGWSLLGVLLVLGAMVLYALGEWMFAEQTGLGLVVAPVLLVLTVAALRRRVAEERSFDLGGVLLTSLGLRMVLAYPRYVGGADSITYNREGARLALSFRRLEFVHVDVGTAAPVPGTGSLRYLTGLVHVLTDSNFFGSTLVFAFAAFWGCWFLYRAFTIAVPDGDHRRYALLLFLWPSLLFWPSSIGKDSWMLLTLGLAALGTAKLLTRQRWGYLLIGAGLALAALVRPHVSLLVFAAIAVAFLVGRRSVNRIPGQVSLAGITKVIGIVALLVAGSLLAPATARFLKLDELSSSTVTSALDQTQVQTSQGGSAYRPVNPNSPIGYPVAVATVLFRPVPGEVRGVSANLSGLEGMALLLIVATSWRRLWSAVRRLRSQPYVAFAAAYVAMFAYAFSAIANFGILARERVQVVPLVFVLVALPKAYRREHGAATEPDPVRAPVSSSGSSAVPRTPPAPLLGRPRR